MEAIFNVVLPVFAIILCGYACGVFRVLGEASSEALNRFVYMVALPVMLFYAMARVEPAEVFQWTYIGGFGLACVITLAAATLWSRMMHGNSGTESVLFGMSAIFGNTVYMGIPLAVVAFGDDAALPAIIAGVFQSSVMLAVVVMMFETASSSGAGLLGTIGRVARAVIQNPLVIAAFAGIAWSLTGIDLPAPVVTFCSILSAAAGPSALFAIGLFLVDKPLRRGLGEVAANTVFKLAFQPLVTWVLFTYVFHVSPTWTAVAVMLAALPTGANSFVLAQHYGVYEQRTSAIILISTVVAVVTVSVLFSMPIMDPR